MFQARDGPGCAQAWRGLGDADAAEDGRASVHRTLARGCRRDGMRRRFFGAALVAFHAGTLISTHPVNVTAGSAVETCFEGAINTLGEIGRAPITAELLRRRLESWLALPSDASGIF